MANKIRQIRQRFRDGGLTWGSGVVVLILSFIAAYQFVGPAPPNSIVLATGEEGGAYQRYGELIAEFLATEGIDTELRATAGSEENLALLDGDYGVDLGFVQGGLADAVPTENVFALASLYLEPLWFFASADLNVLELGDLAGKRISVGAEGSGTRAVAVSLLNAHGVNAQNSELLGMSPDDLSNALTTDKIDAAFIVSAPESDQIIELINSVNVRLRTLNSVDAYVRRFPYFSSVELPRGVLDLQEEKPETDIQTVALTAMLAANSGLHPALIDLLLVGATQIYGEHSLLADAGTFPTPRFTDLPLSEEAERHFRYGPSFLMRYLPFWAATLLDRMWVMILPLIGIAIPLVKLLPPAYRWQIRRRLLRLYSELDQIDPLRNPVRDDADLRARIDNLEKLDNSSVIQSVPREYTDDVYKLRRDIDLVRRRVIGDSVMKTRSVMQD